VVRLKRESESLGHGVRCPSIRDFSRVCCTLPNALSMILHPKAIFIGTITDLVLSFLVGPLLLYPFDVYITSSYLPEWSLVVGLIAVTIGGYITARRSPSAKIFNAVIFALIQILIGIFGAVFIPSPFWFNVASFILIVPVTLFGAYVALRTK
jgi:hypothetical protein